MQIGDALLRRRRLPDQRRRRHLAAETSSPRPVVRTHTGKPGDPGQHSAITRYRGRRRVRIVEHVRPLIEGALSPRRQHDHWDAGATTLQEQATAPADIDQPRHRSPRLSSRARRRRRARHQLEAPTDDPEDPEHAARQETDADDNAHGSDLPTPEPTHQRNQSTLLGPRHTPEIVSGKALPGHRGRRLVSPA